MTNIYYEKDAKLSAIEGLSLAVVGYGNQGRSWALNLRDSGLDPRVWVLDKESMTVSALPVKIGRMVDREIEVVEGLKGGEEIVAVGAPYLAEGMQVTRMAQSEQAVPRADDPI